MIIGIDFDNTIVCYDSVFRQIANDSGIEIPQGLSPKKAVQNALRSRSEGEWLWSLVQGEAYGPRIMEASPFEGLIPALETLNRKGHSLHIVSHKTAFPNAGEAHPLQSWARRWIMENLPDFFAPSEIHLCDSKYEKIATIERIQCDCFIDDLEDVLTDSAFPEFTLPILFDPTFKPFAEGKTHPIAHARDWFEILELIPESVDSRLPQTKSEPDKTALERIQSCFATKTVIGATPLSGGRNSKVYLISLEREASCVAKAYNINPLDPRNRFHNETEFLRYAATIQPKRTPLLLHADSKQQCSLIEHAIGELASESPNPDRDWNACLDFYRSLQRNRFSEQALRLPRAAESASSFQEHLDWISKRRAYWLKQAHAMEVNCKWKNWILEKLEPAFQGFSKTLICHNDFKSRVSPDSFFISPSDFGLHNALRQADGSLVFIDFEYGGWDDPAKTLSDFFLQPRASPPKSLFEDWKQAILDMLPDDQGSAFERRLPLVWLCCAIKWIYIILHNRLDPETLQPNASDLETAQALEKLETRLRSIQSSMSDHLAKSYGPS